MLKRRQGGSDVRFVKVKSHEFDKVRNVDAIPMYSKLNMKADVLAGRGASGVVMVKDPIYITGLWLHYRSVKKVWKTRYMTVELFMSWTSSILRKC